MISSNPDFYRFLETVNAIRAFERHGTVELRFLSSQIIQEPERFLSFIQYFMALPQLAARKKELLIKVENLNYRIVRQPGNKVSIVRDRRRIRQANVPVQTLKMPERRPMSQPERKEDLLAKYGALVQKRRAEQQSAAQDQQIVQRSSTNV